MLASPCFCRCPCHDTTKPTPEPEPEKKLDIDLKQWKLTLPTGKPEKPTEILNPELQTYEDVNFDKGGPSDGFQGIRFIAPVGGVTTSGSGYPRCELREMNHGQLAQWDIDGGMVHTMTWTGYVVETPVAKPQVVIGQIHDAADDVIMIRFTGTPASTLDIMLQGKTHTQIPWKLNQYYTLSIQCIGREIKVTLDGKQVFNWIRTRPLRGCYFKVGAYTQSNSFKGDKPAARGVVVVEKVEVTHMGV
jgi:poly(beta-D-mannuronate) lyase